LKPLLLIGGGGHCHACIDVIESEKKHRIAGIVLPTRGDHADVLGYPVIGADEDLPELLAQTANAIVTVGQIKSGATRIELFYLLKAHGANLPIIQSSLSYRSKHACIGEGTILMHGSLVNAGAQVGVNCIINSQTLIEHDVEIADHCHISTGARVNGSVRIGEGTFVGSGSILKEGLKIGTGVVIGAGQLISKDVPDGMMIKAQHG
jgi:sugar O-acyltransferase (sialic acid O-acetyltransferase NeuD family)